MTTVSTSPVPQLSEPLIRLPMWKLSFCLVAAPKLTLYAGLIVLAVLAGDLWDERLRAEVYASISLYIGVGAGLLFLWFLQAPLASWRPLAALAKFARLGWLLDALGRLTEPRTATQWRPLVLASTVMRLIISMGAAVAFHHLTHPVEKFYWTVFTIASSCIWFVEARVISRALRATIRLAGADDDRKSQAA